MLGVPNAVLRVEKHPGLRTYDFSKAIYFWHDRVGLYGIEFAEQAVGDGRECLVRLS